MIIGKKGIVQAAILAIIVGGFLFGQYRLRPVYGAPQETAAMEAGAETAKEQAAEDQAAAGQAAEDQAAAGETADGQLAPAVHRIKDPGLRSAGAVTETYQVMEYEEAMVMYAADAVNIRKGPAVDYDRVGALTRGQEVSVTGAADTGWYQIRLAESIAFVSDKYLQQEKPEELLAANDAAGAENINAADASQKQAEVPVNEVPAAVQQTPAQNTAGIIFVGDSRTVQMREAVGDNPYTWIAENSRGYKWLRDNAMTRIDNNVGQGTKIVILLGVNDANHYRDYLELVNAKVAGWVGAGASVYFSSCNQVWPNPYTSEEEVATFNQKMREGLSSEVIWIDSFSYLEGAGYKLLDGLHFDADTYIKLYSFYLGSI